MGGSVRQQQPWLLLRHSCRPARMLAGCAVSIHSMSSSTVVQGTSPTVMQGTSPSPRADHVLHRCRNAPPLTGCQTAAAGPPRQPAHWWWGRPPLAGEPACKYSQGQGGHNAGHGWGVRRLQRPAAA